METKRVSLKTLLLALGALGSVEAAAWAVTAQGLSPPLLSLGAARLAEIILLAVVVSFGETGPATIGLARAQIVPGLRRGLLWSLGFGALAGAGLAVLAGLGLDPLAYLRTPLPSTPGALVLFFVTGSLVAPVAEEMFFRGLVYGFFRRWGVPPALVLSTALFVLAHWPGPRFPLTQLVGGVVFALAYEMEGRLLVPVTIHVLGNAALFTLSLGAF